MGLLYFQCLEKCGKASREGATLWHWVGKYVGCDGDDLNLFLHLGEGVGDWSVVAYDSEWGVARFLCVGAGGCVCDVWWGMGNSLVMVNLQEMGCNVYER